MSTMLDRHTSYFAAFNDRDFDAVREIIHPDRGPTDVLTPPYTRPPCRSRIAFDSCCSSVGDRPSTR